MNTNETFPWPVHPAAELFPLLGDEELSELADDIRKHGLLEPVWLYRGEQGTMLLDGRNRYRACEQASVELRMRYYDGADPIAFSLSLNMKRRHLTAGQKAFTALEVEKLYAAEAAKRKAQASGMPRGEKQSVSADLREENARERRSDERAAKATGASGRAVSQAKRVAEKAPDLAEKVKAGQLALDRAERRMRDREAERKRVEQAHRENAASGQPVTVDIRHGDFRGVLADLNGIDAIITDPPYPHEFIPLLADLAAWADKVLKPDGILAVLMGQSYLPEVYRLLDGHRPYRWTAAYMTSGTGYSSYQRRLQSHWKPLIIYGGGPRFDDVVRSAQRADGKPNHPWEQDYEAFRTIVERLTERGQTVADPFMGSGTTLLAAHALGRHAIGCDIDAESVTTARQRLA